jgi:hypothetical protein
VLHVPGGRVRNYVIQTVNGKIEERTLRVETEYNLGNSFPGVHKTINLINIIKELYGFLTA